MDKKEILYTSTDNKLLAHRDLLEDIKKDLWRPMSIQLAPTDLCNLRCNMCSVDNRNGDTLSLEQVKTTLEEFKKLGAKTVELTGGGDPTMYHSINETIQYAKELGYEIGMISNGVLLTKKISQDNLDMLTWLRISLNSLDYVKDINVPKINGTLGFSYVWTELSDFNKLDKIAYYAEKYGSEFVRVVPNCLDVKTKDEYIESIKPVIEKYPQMFFQQKEHNVPEKCWIGYIKPFVNADGNIYQCSANPLINRKFDTHWKIGEIGNIPKMYEDVKSFDTSKCEEGKCFFKSQNDLIRDVIDGKEIPETKEEPKHKNFI